MSSATLPVDHVDTPNVPKLTGFVVELLRDGQHSRFSEGVHDRNGADDYAAKFNAIGEGTGSEARVWAADVRLLGPADADTQPERFDVFVRRGSQEEVLEVLLKWKHAVRFVRAHARDRRDADKALIRPTQHLAEGGAA